MTPGLVECTLFQIEFRLRPASDRLQVTGCIGPNDLWPRPPDYRPVRL